MPAGLNNFRKSATVGFPNSRPAVWFHTPFTLSAVSLMTELASSMKTLCQRLHYCTYQKCVPVLEHIIFSTILHVPTIISHAYKNLKPAVINGMSYNYTQLYQ